ncbi:MCE family protein [Mycobacterium sp. DL592]|uniref:MCE family protein n=1 Tax=Mycobacterium sp. DL592 TaxID=2675524 RepID=UPI001422B05D|nr:MCE family protein [Mycobacterium sp. DL592]
MRRKRFVVAAAALLAVLLLAGATFLVRQMYFAPTKITAYFPSATGIYAGDEVRISGVKVGKITSIEPDGTQAKIMMNVDHGVPIPADAKAVIVAQNLVAARYLQLTPAYRKNSGAKMASGAVIPVERTAVPVEWDEVKNQITRLATDLGPKGNVSTTSVSKFIDSAANALDGNGEKLRQTIAQFSSVSRVLAEGSGNIVDVIKNLQAVVTTLRDSNVQIVAFQNRLATLTSVINDSSSDLDGAISNLSVAIGEVQRFIAETRDPTSEQIQRLGNVTQILVDNKTALENVLHISPTAFANGYNIYNPDTGDFGGGFTLPNFSSPVGFICGSIGALENTTAPETAKLCAQYLGPALRLLNFNYIPIPTNPYLMKSANPDNIVYTDPSLAPGGPGPARGPEDPPAVSAYTGLNNDEGAPPNYGQPPAIAPGPTAPDVPHAPVYPSPALLPGQSVPTVSNLPGMLMPGTRGPIPDPSYVPPPAAPATAAPPGPPLPAEGTP